MTPSEPLPPPRPMDPGRPAVAPDGAEHDRRGRRAGFSTRAWARRALSERRLGTRLDRGLAGCAIVLHHRTVPGRAGKIDHLVVAPTGVWVIGAVYDAGSVEHRRSKTDRGGTALVVDGLERPELVDEMAWRKETVEQVLARIGFDWVDAHPVLCVTSARRSLLARPFAIGELWVTWAKPLVERIAAPGPVSPGEATTIANELSARFPAIG